MCIERDHPKISMRRQCQMLSLSRSGLYFQPKGESAENLRFMEHIDKQFLETPWYGSRQPLGAFPSEIPCRSVNGAVHEAARPQMRTPSNTALDAADALGADPLPGRVLRSNAREGIRSPIPARSTRSTRSILTCCASCRSRVLIKSSSRACKHALPGKGCVDITYIPMRRGFLYLVAIMDWYSRKVLSWRL